MVDNVIPEMVGRYKVINELGRGGMAAVYKALDPNFDREVAVKVLPRALLHDPKFRARFEREGKMIARLEHNAIVPVYDFGEQDGQPYIVMRLMTGGSLSLKINDHAPFSLKETSRILNRMAGGLDVAHSKGVIHRDMKPGNVLFDDYGDAYLSDFGIARLVGSDATLTGSGIIGTPAYMSPEQIQGERDIDGRTDIYSLGVILYLMLSDEMPFDADTPGKLMMQHVLEPVPNLSLKMADIPDRVSAVIAKAMAKDPDDRYQTGMEMADEFAKAVDYGTMHVSKFDLGEKDDLDDQLPTMINKPVITKSTAPTKRLPTSATAQTPETKASTPANSTELLQPAVGQPKRTQDMVSSAPINEASAATAVEAAVGQPNSSSDIAGADENQDFGVGPQSAVRKTKIWVWAVAAAGLLAIVFGGFFLFYKPDNSVAISNSLEISESSPAVVAATETSVPTATAIPPTETPIQTPTADQLSVVPTEESLYSEITPTETQPAETPTATPESSIVNEEQWQSFFDSANILIFEDSSSILFPYVNETVKNYPSNVVWDGNAYGKTVSDISSGPGYGQAWDLVIVAFENRSKSSGEMFPYIKAALENGASVILEAWQLDHTTQPEMGELLELCGVEVKEYLPRNQYSGDLIVYPIIGATAHPILSEPNSGFSFTKVDDLWMQSGDLGDLMSLTGTGDAELLIGRDTTNSTRDGVLANCVDGRLTIMTFSSHTFPYDVVSPLWENMIYYALKSRLRYLNQ